jgi:proteic killer suppression protein
VIESFRDKDTKKIPKDVQRIGLRKLILIHRAKDINDLRVPPGNMLEQLTANRKGQYSIRINDQWRVCFYWNNGSASEVEITDYH